MSKSSFPSATSSIERYMTDTVRITRPTDIDDEAIDPVTLKILESVPEILYEGKALISPMGDPGDQLIGMGPRVTLYYTVALPVLDIDFIPDDVITVLQAVSDTQMVDRRFIVEGQIPSTIMVYKRLRARMDEEAS